MIAVVLVVVLGSVLYLWPTSHSLNHRLEGSLFGGSDFIVSSQRGYLCFAVFRWHGAWPWPWGRHLVSVPANHWRAFPGWPAQDANALGFGFTRHMVIFVMDPMPPGGGMIFGAATATLRDGGMVVIHHGNVAILLAACLLMLWFKPALRIIRRPSKHGLCVKCGYDLRASVDRCPECGKPIDAMTR